LDDVSALSEARFQEELRTGTMVWRAFDKAVRRKPPVVAADAGPMEIHLWEGAVEMRRGCAAEYDRRHWEMKTWRKRMTLAKSRLEKVERRGL